MELSGYWAKILALGCMNLSSDNALNHCILMLSTLYTFNAANADCSALRRSEVPRNLSCPTPVRKSFRTSESFSSQPNTLQRWILSARWLV